MQYERGLALTSAYPTSTYPSLTYPISTYLSLPHPNLPQPQQLCQVMRMQKHGGCEMQASFWGGYRKFNKVGIKVAEAEVG